MHFNFQLFSQNYIDQFTELWRAVVNKIVNRFFQPITFSVKNYYHNPQKKKLILFLKKNQADISVVRYNKNIFTFFSTSGLLLSIHKT